MLDDFELKVINELKTATQEFSLKTYETNFEKIEQDNKKKDFKTILNQVVKPKEDESIVLKP